MSISSQLLILNETKNNIKTAINLKGVTVTDEAFADYPDKVRQIPSGTGTYESQIILYLEGRLENAVVPTGTTTIGNFAFGVPTSSATIRPKLKTVSIPNSVTTIGEYAFASTILTSITIPSSVTTIGANAFESSKLSGNLTIPSSVTTIGDRAFMWCTNITSLTIGTGATYFGTHVFSDCTSLETVTISTGSTFVGEWMFAVCSALKTVELPDTINEIMKDSFYACGALESITINATTPPQLSSGAFTDTNDTFIIYVPDESVLSYQIADGWTSYSSRIKGISEKPQ